jgi:membrane protein implicated in regulation of membrane protease activity
MEIYVVWFITALILLIVELFTASFGVVCFSFGAAAAGVASYCGLSTIWQLFIFSAVSFIAFVFIRPFVVKFLLKKKDEVLTNADAIVGRQAIVTEEINSDKNTGRVKIDGDDWKAEASEILAVGVKVEVISRDSIILKVKSLK